MLSRASGSASYPRGPLSPFFLKPREVIMFKTDSDVPVSFNRRQCLVALGAGSLGSAWAQTAPAARTLTLIVPFTAGGASDLGGLQVALNARQRDLAATAATAIERSLEAAADGLPWDFWTIDLRQAVRSLGEITGEEVSEAVLDRVFARHKRHSAATRACVEAWGLEVVCQNPAEFSPVLTAVMMPEGTGGRSYDADALRAIALEKFNISLGMGLSKLAGKVFRIGHLGDFNDLSLIGALSGVEMALGLAGVPHKAGGVQAAMQSLAKTA